MATCNGCGGVVGRDCFNPSECEWIARDMEFQEVMRQAESVARDAINEQSGISLRDAFAIAALQGLCANPGGPYQQNEYTEWGIVNCTADQIAEEAYVLADAMLKARTQGEKHGDQDN